MTVIEIKHARVRDDGYGLYVNMKSLDHIISTALGTRLKGETKKPFYKECCNITVIIEPMPDSTITVTTGGKQYSSLERLEEIRLGELIKENEKTETES